jgi:chemotaxis protein CheX
MSGEVPAQKLHEITKNVWSMVLGFRIQPVAFDRGKAAGQEFVLGKVTISGTWQGAVTLGCSADLARRAAAAMFGKSPNQADAGEIRDALGELTNMVGGNYKTLLKGDCKLSVPNVVDTVPFGEMTPSPPEHQWFECEGGMVLVNVAQGLAP